MPDATGRPARCLLFAEQRDKGLHVFFIQRARVELEAIERVGERLNWAGIDGRYDVALSELRGSPPSAAMTTRSGRSSATLRAPASWRRCPRRPTGRRARSPAALTVARRRSAWDRRARPSACGGRSTGRSGSTSRAPAAAARRCSRTSGTARAGRPSVDCCDVCAPSLVPAPPVAVARVAPSGSGGGGDLDSAIIDGSSRRARPPVGRTRAVEILRGGRSKVVVQNAYDGLPDYGSFAHLRSEEVLGRVDELLAAGTLRSSGGRFPKLRAA